MHKHNHTHAMTVGTASRALLIGISINIAYALAEVAVGIRIGSMGLMAVPEEQKEDPFVQGMDKIYKQIMTTLEEIGVKPIEAVGVEFNPDLHNAVMHVEDEEAGENVIVEEFQKGYTYRDCVVRYSMVKVAN